MSTEGVGRAREVAGAAPVPVPAGGRDPGLQPERTVLAWQRTSLAVVVGSLVAARVLAARAGGAAGGAVGVVALVVGSAGVLLGLALLAASSVRARRAAAGGPTGGRLVAAVACGTFALGLAGVAVVVLMQV